MVSGVSVRNRCRCCSSPCRTPLPTVEHIGSGRHYNINSKRGNLQLLFTQKNGASSIYNTDINAYIENCEQIERMPQDYVIIAPSYMVYKQDFQKLLDEHVESGTDITILYHKVDQAKEYYQAEAIKLATALEEALKAAYA